MFCWVEHGERWREQGVGAFEQVGVGVGVAFG